ncbi:MAG: DUF4013 domain-containing protein [Anaerolineaceae bacterium]|nr:DUF4013 domain-containing protein [Anaerolineaceae bacterium]
MNLSRAFTYAFEDPQWGGKLALVLLWGLVAMVPLLGLAGMAMLAGYGLDLLRNQLASKPRPLPEWTDFNSRLGDGFNALVAIFVYNIPNALPLCGLLLFVSSGGEGGILALLTLCCLLLFLLLWNLFIGLMLATGATRYAETRQLTAWFQPGELWDTLRGNSDLFLQWLFYSVLANLVLGLVAGLPFVGWLISLALGVPVQGHLLGQLAVALAAREDDPSAGAA